MESDQSIDGKHVGGINLDNYFPFQSTLNSTLYVHKKFSKESKKKNKKEKILLDNKKSDKDKNMLRKDSGKSKTSYKTKNVSNDTENEVNNDPVLHQTIKFAKNLVPLIIPPSEGSDEVFYTVKTRTKTKNKDYDEGHCEKFNSINLEKKQTNKVVETFKKEKRNRENISVESTTQSIQSNTLDELNQTLSCSISELSDKKEKRLKNTVNNKRRKRDSNKLVISESFEGLATELNNDGQSNIKVHLMSEKEKHFLSESIRVPIVNAVNDCFKDMNDIKIKEDMKSLHRLVMSNSMKLDNILERVSCIENYLAKTNANSPRSPKVARKPSKLEQLGEDILDEKEYSSEEEMSKNDINNKGDEITVIMHRDRRVENFGCGELTQNQPSSSVGVRTERNRLPARFCWTDSDRNN